MPQILTIKGERFYLLNEAEYRKLDNGSLPPLPPADSEGTVSAMDYARASLGRKIARSMIAAGLSQAELARQAGVRAETLNRILKAKVSPDRRTIEKLDRILTQSSGRRKKTA
jgi:ribosome-binding protein aMBF1 (putative translation factor)